MGNLVQKYGYYSCSVLRLLFGFHNPVRIAQIFLTRTPSSPRKVSLSRYGVSFWVRGPMEVWILKETWLDRFYERYGTSIQDGWTVMDVGAGIGDFAIYAALRSPTGTVYAFEPFPESFRLLEENLRTNRVENVRAFPEALAARTGEVTLDTSSGEPLQFGTSAPVHPSEGLVVPALSLADALERVGGRCDLMKMDCEGAEYEIFFNAPDPVLQQIARLVMEVHEKPDIPYNRIALAEFLRAKGLRVHLYPNPVHSNLGFLYAERL